MGRAIGLGFVVLVTYAIIHWISPGLTGQEAPTRILPFQAEVTLSNESSSNAWVGHIGTSRARNAYELRLEPEIDIANNVAGWNIVLCDSAKPNRNLLEPQGRWHGLQAFMIVANDMRFGPEKSALGAHRTLKVPKRGLIVDVDVKEARVSREQVTDYYAFELLRVSVSVDNL